MRTHFLADAAATNRLPGCMLVNVNIACKLKALNVDARTKVQRILLFWFLFRFFFFCFLCVSNMMLCG